MDSNLEKALNFKTQKVIEVLEILSKNDQIVFRGGTALYLTHKLIKRTSEDIDISILKGDKSAKDVWHEIEQLAANNDNFIKEYIEKACYLNHIKWTSKKFLEKYKPVFEWIFELVNEKIKQN